MNNDKFKQYLRTGNTWSKTKWTMDEIKAGFIEFYRK